MTIDFELTKRQFLEQWRLQMSGLRRSPFAWLMSGACLWFALGNFGQGPRWIIGLNLIVAIYPLWMPWLIEQLCTTIAFWSRSTLQMRIEVDNTGITTQWINTSQPSHLFLWSDFKELSETNVGIEVKFRGSYYGTIVPWIAFQDDEHRSDFMRLVNSYVSPRGIA